MSGYRRELDALMKELGGVLEKSGTHLIYRVQGHRICAPSTPSDWRTLRNLRARVIRRIEGGDASGKSKGR